MASRSEADPAGFVMTQLQGDNCNLLISRDVAAKEGKEMFMVEESSKAAWLSCLSENKGGMIQAEQ